MLAWGRIVALCIWLVAGGASAAPGGARADDAIDFNIAAQDLDAAIDAFAEASGAQVLYESALTAEHRSAAIKGRLRREVALQSLLRRTPLKARFTGPDTFTIVLPDTAREHGYPRPPGSATPPPGARLRLSRDGRFLGAVQTDVLNVLCHAPLIRPGSYRVTMRLWIGADGDVADADVVGSTGSTARDAAIATALRQLRFAVAPPPEMQQPLVVVIEPRDPAHTGDCSRADANAAPRAGASR